jgi:hypothetical protein
MRPVSFQSYPRFNPISLASTLAMPSSAIAKTSVGVPGRGVAKRTPLPVLFRIVNENVLAAMRAALRIVPHTAGGTPDSVFLCRRLVHGYIES